MNFLVRFSPLCFLFVLGVSLRGDEPFLPLPVAGPEIPVYENAVPATGGFLKPTKSIKPPVPSRTVVAAGQPQVTAPTVARLRRLILMPGGLPPEAMREQLVAGGQSRTPVTVVGLQAPAPVLTNLAGFFGADVNADTQKQLLDTVSKGMSGNTQHKARRRVELVGWLPAEGVMAVAVYPEG